MSQKFIIFFSYCQILPRGLCNLLLCAYNNLLIDSAPIDSLYSPIHPRYYQWITPLKLLWPCSFTAKWLPMPLYSLWNKFKPSTLVKNFSQAGSNLPNQAYLLLFELTHYNSCSCPTMHGCTVLPVFIHIVSFFHCWLTYYPFFKAPIPPFSWSSWLILLVGKASTLSAHT